MINGIGTKRRKDELKKNKKEKEKMEIMRALSRACICN